MKVFKLLVVNVFVIKLKILIGVKVIIILIIVEIVLVKLFKNVLVFGEEWCNVIFKLIDYVKILMKFVFVRVWRGLLIRLNIMVLIIWLILFGGVKLFGFVINFKVVGNRKFNIIVVNVVINVFSM